MKSKVVKVVTALVLLTAVIAVGLGLSSPDGEVDDASPSGTRTPEASATATAEPEPEATEPPAPAAPQAPADPSALSPVTGVWPGRPASVTETAGVVDWCPAVQVEVTDAARRAVGEEAARAAACQAVAFTFDVRYSRLSLPRQGYVREDFVPAATRLSDGARGETYPGRVDAVVASPRSSSAREGTGLVLLDGPSPGGGRQFFGPEWSEAGYADRPVWVDPAWSVVRVDLQRGGSRPRLTARLDASAAVPVWNPATSAAEKLTVATTASYVLAGSDWRVDGWTLSEDRQGFRPLA